MHETIGLQAGSNWYLERTQIQTCVKLINKSKVARNVRPTSSHDHQSDAVCPTPASPSLINIPNPEKTSIESGHHAFRGALKIAYQTERIEIRFKEMAVASGAPMNPRRIGAGPQTERRHENEFIGFSASREMSHRGGSSAGHLWARLSL